MPPEALPPVDATQPAVPEAAPPAEPATPDPAATTEEIIQEETPPPDIYDQIVEVMALDSYEGVVISADEQEKLLGNISIFRCGQKAFVRDLAWALSSQNDEYRLSKNELDWLFYNHEKHATRTFNLFANTETCKAAACYEVFADMGYTAFSDTEAQKLSEEIKINREFFKGWGVPITLKMLTRLPLGRPPIDAAEEEPPVLMATEALSLKYTSDYRAMARLLDAYVANGYEEEAKTFLTAVKGQAPEVATKIKSRMQHEYVSQVSEANQTVTLTWLDETYVYEVSVKPPQAQLNQPPPPAPEKPNQEKLEQIARDFVEWYDGEDLSEVQSDTINIGETSYIVTIQGNQAPQPQPQPISETTTTTAAASTEQTPLTASDAEDSSTEDTPEPRILPPYFKLSSKPSDMVRRMLMRESERMVPSVTLYTADELYPVLPLPVPKPPHKPISDMTLEEIMELAPTTTLERPLISESISSQGWKPDGVINGIEINQKGAGAAIRGIKKGLTLSPVQIAGAIMNIWEYKGPIRSIEEIKVLHKGSASLVYGVITSDKTFSIIEMAGTKASADEVIIEFQSYELSWENVFSSLSHDDIPDPPKDKKQEEVEESIARWFRDLGLERVKQLDASQYDEGRWIYKKQADGTWILTLEWLADPKRTPDFVANYMNDIIQFAAKQEREREVE